MSKGDERVPNLKKYHSKPAETPEERENQLINLSYDLVEKRIRDGKASSTEVTHFLKLGTTRNRLELAKLKAETELIRSKQDSIESSKRSEELYEKAIQALKRYSGEGDA